MCMCMCMYIYIYIYIMFLRPGGRSGTPPRTYHSKTRCALVIRKDIFEHKMCACHSKGHLRPITNVDYNYYCCCCYSYSYYYYY